MSETSTPPTNVRLVLDDNTEVPVDCVYEGMENAIHRWLVLVPSSCAGRVTGMRAGVFPARTGIALTQEDTR